jgi:hypothetical protein
MFVGGVNHHPNQLTTRTEDEPAPMLFLPLRPVQALGSRTCDP